MRVVIAHDANMGRWLMMRMSHHLIEDATSLRIILRELQAHLRGETDTLRRTSTISQFRGAGVSGDGDAEHEAFFREMLGDVEEPTAPFGLIDVQEDGKGD